MSTMRQAVIVAPDRLELRQGVQPTLQSGEEVIVRTVASGICSGDLMPWYLAKKVNTVLGHEVVGRAFEVGEAIGHIKPGDLVFLHHHAPCLNCPACHRRAFVHCDTWKRSKLDPGGMADFIRVPGEISRVDLFAVNDLHPERAVFIEPLACCVKAFDRIGGPRAIEGQRVIIVGCGIMGLLNIQLALAYQAGEVVGIEPDPQRRDFAQSLGAHRTLTPDEAGRELSRWADVVIIGPGHPEVIRQSLAYVRDAGVACLFAPTATGALTPLDLGDLYFREVSLVPAYSCSHEDTRAAYDLLRQGRVAPERIVTHRFPLSEVQTAFATARRGGAALKVLVTFEEPS